MGDLGAVTPDLGPGALVVGAGVGIIGVLVEEAPLRMLVRERLGPPDGAIRALAAGRQDELSAVGSEQQASLLAHRVGHGERELVSPGGADKGERDAGVAAGRFEDDRVGLDLARLLGGVDHGHTDPVLDAVRWAVELELRHHAGSRTFRETAQPDQRGVADQLGHVVRDSHRGLSIPEEDLSQYSILRSEIGIMRYPVFFKAFIRRAERGYVGRSSAPRRSGSPRRRPRCRPG